MKNDMYNNNINRRNINNNNNDILEEAVSEQWEKCIFLKETHNLFLLYEIVLNK